MSYSLRAALALTFLGCATVFVACSSDSGDDSGAGASGGSAGKGGTGGAAGSHSGGSSGTSAGKGGGGTAGATAGTGGKAGSAGDSALGGEGGGPEGGASEGGASEGGTNSGGAAPEAGAGGDDSAGAAGTGGLVYSCGTVTLEHKLCSALVAANCSIATVCADCVQQFTDQKTPLATCPVCAAKVDEFYQCAVTAYETGHLSDGVECLDGYGADLSNDNCYPIFFAANDCETYYESNSVCPATWPM